MEKRQLNPSNYLKISLFYVVINCTFISWEGWGGGDSAFFVHTIFSMGENKYEKEGGIRGKCIVQRIHECVNK